MEEKVQLASWDSHRYMLGNKSRGDYLKKYQGMQTERRRKMVAQEASDNGRCWWIFHWIYSYNTVDINKGSRKRVSYDE